MIRGPDAAVPAFMSTLAARIVAGFGPHRGHMGGRVGHPFMFMFGLLLLAGVVIAIVLLVRGNRHTKQFAGNPQAGALTPAGSAETILSERFARGEVSVEDFVAARAALRGEWTPTRTVAATTATMPVPPAPPSE